MIQIAGSPAVTVVRITTKTKLKINCAGKLSNNVGSFMFVLVEIFESCTFDRGLVFEKLTQTWINLLGAILDIDNAQPLPNPNHTKT